MNALARRCSTPPANRATFSAEVMTRAVAPRAIAAVIASWSATPHHLGDTWQLMLPGALSGVCAAGRR